MIPMTEAVELIQMEYAEMPELRLTFWQAKRLWNLSEDLCERALNALIVSGFLVRTPDGSYVRRSGSPTSVPSVASFIQVNPGAIR